MKFRLIMTLVLLAIMAIMFAIIESNQPQVPTQSAPSDQGLSIGQ